MTKCTSGILNIQVGSYQIQVFLGSQIRYHGFYHRSYEIQDLSTKNKRESDRIQDPLLNGSTEQWDPTRS